MKIRLLFLLSLCAMTGIGAYAQNNPIFGFGDASGHAQGSYNQVYPVLQIGFSDGSGSAAGCFQQNTQLGSNPFGFGDGSGHSLASFNQNGPQSLAIGFGNASGFAAGCFQQNAPIGGVMFGFSDGSGATVSCFQQVLPGTSGSNNLIFGFGSQSGYVSGCTFSPIPLPVSIIRFEANIVGKGQTALSWTSAQAHQLRHYIVQRSTNLNNWETLGKVNAQNTPFTATYTFTDFTTNKLVYYQLLSEDINGAITSHGIREVRFDEPAQGIVFNNPADEWLQVLLPGYGAGSLSIQLYHLNGVMAMEHKSTGEVHRLNVETLQAGCYMMRVLNEQGTLMGTYKVVIY